jgi:restriction system protein
MASIRMVRLGAQARFLQECLDGNFIGVDFGFGEDLSGQFPDEWREFNKEWVPRWLELHPGKSRVAAGLSCALTWVLAHGLMDGTLILSPDDKGNVHFCRITGGYQHVAGSHLPHQRPVTWLNTIVAKSDMSEALRRTLGVPLTVVELAPHATEIFSLIGEGPAQTSLMSSDPTVEDPSVFALEKHLEDFLVANWAATLLGSTHKIYEVDGEKVGQQFLTDTGPMDILAISHDGSRLLVVELKKGRASDSVVGQIQRYMGYVKEELAEPNQTVHGIIIALEDDLKIRRALSIAPNIDFYKYEVTFKLSKA